MIVDSNYQKIRPRRGTKEDWIAKNPILSDGEIGRHWALICRNISILKLRSNLL